MRKIKKLLVVIFALTIVFVFTACGGGSGGSSDETFELKCGTHYNTSHAGYKMLEECAKNIEEKTDGKVKIKLYPSSQLGDYTNMYEQLMNGSLDMAMISIPSEYDAKLEMNFVPYMMTDYSQLEQAMGPDSYFFKTYKKVHDDLGVNLLGSYVEGMIGIGTTKYPKHYKDPTVKQGLKIRAPAIEVYSLVTRDLGYSSTTINYSDLYSALQTGVCDGWIGGTPQLNYSDFKDVIKYYIPYNMFAENGGYFMSNKTWEKLPEEYQNVIQECVTEEVLKSFKEAETLDKENLKKMEEYGIEILPLTEDELNNCRERVIKDVWPKLYDKIGEDNLKQLADSVN